MRVAILAAGIGTRLDPAGNPPPKVLLRFGGETLLKRHLDMLVRYGLCDLTLVVGHRADEIHSELAALGATDMVCTRFNPDFRDSSLLSLWTLREVFAGGEPVLYMDADVLYDWRLLARLLESPYADCLLIDRSAELTEESLKVCVRSGRVVDFHKSVEARVYDYAAEWIGFARFGPASAARLADTLQSYVAAGRTDVIYEEPMRDVILKASAFGLADATGLPWIEIDFPDDLHRAQSEILPRLVRLPPMPR